MVLKNKNIIEWEWKAPERVEIVDLFESSNNQNLETLQNNNSAETIKMASKSNRTDIEVEQKLRDDMYSPL